MDGVSVRFMAASIKSLDRQYGAKMTGPVEPMNDLIRALGEAERAYRRLADAPPEPDAAGRRAAQAAASGAALARRGEVQGG